MGSQTQHRATSSCSPPPRPPKEAHSASNAEPVQPAATPGPSTSFARVLDELLDAPWYWGDVTPLEATEILDRMPDGTFLVRDSSNVRSLFAITYKTTGGVIGSSRIKFRDGMFSLNANDRSLFGQFPSVVALVDDCMERSKTQPVCMVKIGGQPFPVHLRHPLVRHEPKTLQELCRRSARSHFSRTRLEDSGNGLPLSMRQYLLSCQFRPSAGCKIGPYFEPAETAV